MRGSIIAAAAAVFLGTASMASADVQLTIHDGRVTIVAKDATIRQILAEWARVGQTKISNVDRIPGGPVTLELRDVSEQQALRVLLRSLGGYVTAPRTTMVANASVFDRILVMPVVAPAPSPVSAAAPPPPFAAFQPPQFQPPQFQQPQDDDRDDNIPPPGGQQPGNRGPVFAFPPPAGVGQPQQPAPASQPSSAIPTRGPAASFPGAPTTAAPVGVSVPGMIVPAPPPPPGQPGFPVAQPSQPGLRQP
ncbi:MAG: hypothetical protein ABJA98_07365 [Acidobacteriota bacterium]